MLSAADLGALWLTFKVAATTTFLLLLLGTPLAWWLANTQSRWRTPLNVLIAMPLVLPPVVLGFYLLMLLGPEGVIGRATNALGLGVLPFTFWGVVIASCVYSLPFVVQPLQNTFQSIGRDPLRVAAMLGASPFQAFVQVLFPLAKPGFLTAGVLGFAHTVGEFGVVLMVGGNIPDKTRLVSMQIYNHVEAMNYSGAHSLSAILLIGSFFVLLLAYASTRSLSVNSLSRTGS